MALWQYSFIVIPTESVGDVINIDDKNCELCFNDEILWISKLIRKDFFEEINLILPKSNSWSSKIDLYGDEESNNMEIYFQGLNVISASLRIDFRTDYSDILNAILEFFILRGFSILDENLKLVPLNFQIVQEIIKSSPQFEKYLRWFN